MDAIADSHTEHNFFCAILPQSHTGRAVTVDKLLPVVVPAALPVVFPAVVPVAFPADVVAIVVVAVVLVAIALANNQYVCVGVPYIHAHAT